MNGAVTIVECPTCQGEGCVDQAIPGGRWSSAAGQWYPDYRVVECRTCGGSGEVEEIDDEEVESWR